MTFVLEKAIVSLKNSCTLTNLFKKYNAFKLQPNSADQISEYGLALEFNPGIGNSCYPPR